jgi:hypothetical protein
VRSQPGACPVDRAQCENPESAAQATANSAERNLTAVMTGLKSGGEQSYGMARPSFWHVNGEFLFELTTALWHESYDRMLVTSEVRRQF